MTISPNVKKMNAEVRKHFKWTLKTLRSFPEEDRKLRNLIQECDCSGYKKNLTITFDSQDLYEGGYTKCPYCKKPFASRRAKKGR